MRLDHWQEMPSDAHRETSPCNTTQAPLSWRFPTPWTSSSTLLCIVNPDNLMFTKPRPPNHFASFPDSHAWITFLLELCFPLDCGLDSLTEFLLFAFSKSASHQVSWNLLPHSAILVMVPTVFLYPTNRSQVQRALLFFSFTLPSWCFLDISIPLFHIIHLHRHIKTAWLQ